MGLIDRIRTGRYAPDTAPPLAVAGTVLSLYEAGRRIRHGEDELAVARDALDQLARCEDAALVEAIADAPELTGDRRADALLAGIAEHLVARRGISPPTWTAEPARFLDQFWFVSDVPGFRAIAIAQTPISLRRRGILWSERSLRRN
jgi:hypothetical protein